MTHIGGTIYDVVPFRPYMKRSWIKLLRPHTARRRFLRELQVWGQEIRTIPLTTMWMRDDWDEGIQVARGGEDYSRLLNSVFYMRYNLYCLSTYRQTIEELALGASVYNCRTMHHTDEMDKAAIADLKRLLRLSKMFLMAEWVQDMIERAIANRDAYFFSAVSNSLRRNLTDDPSMSAVQWLLVILLWFAGGKDYPRRRDFLLDLQRHDILPWAVDEYTFSAQLRKLGITKA
jgi:hypothetical protein